MDRERQDELPGLQLEWIDGVCLPLYRASLQSSLSIIYFICSVITSNNKRAAKSLHEQDMPGSLEHDDCRLVTDARARRLRSADTRTHALRAPSATEHLLPRHRGCGTVCGNLECHMDNLGVH